MASEPAKLTLLMLVWYESEWAKELMRFECHWLTKVATNCLSVLHFHCRKDSRP